MTSWIWVFLFALACAGCGSDPTLSVCGPLTSGECAEPDAGVPDGGAPLGLAVVVDVDWLEARLGDPDVQPIDTRSSGYDASRIPGAIELRPSDLARTIDGVSSQLVPAIEAEPVLRAAALRNDVTALVYGGSPEYDAARVVWALRYYGHLDVRYLDGGFAAWIEAGGALDTDPPNIEPSEYSIEAVNEDILVRGDWVLSQLGDAPYDAPAIQLVDARSNGEYDAGHIPSARSVNWTQNLNNGLLRPRAELEVLYAGLAPDRTTVTYCATGLRGSFAWLTLSALGYSDARLYDGSWNEWGAGGFPVEN
jgi:thiosulfate/3-mercaptopyruvate sulfurtransferase